MGHNRVSGDAAGDATALSAVGATRLFLGRTVSAFVVAQRDDGGRPLDWEGVSPDAAVCLAHHRSYAADPGKGSWPPRDFWAAGRVCVRVCV
jgi:hypothetical protein